jgi:hypothetical protein
MKTHALASAVVRGLSPSGCVSRFHQPPPFLGLVLEERRLRVRCAR